jgi:poly(hydroxyalkanoate) depolymerase family esterase
MNRSLRRYEFSERLAEILGESRRDLRFRVTLMVTHGLLPPGPRGPGSPPATPDYAAALLIGVMAAPQQVHTVEAIRCYRQLEPTILAPEAATPGVVVGATVRQIEKPEPPRLLSHRLRFGDALARLLDQARDPATRGELARDLFGVWVARGFPVAAVQLAAWWQGRRTIMTQRYELPEGGLPPAWLDPERGGAVEPGLFHSVFLPVGKLIDVGTLTAIPPETFIKSSTERPTERKPRVLNLNLDQTIANFATLARNRRNRRPWEKFLETAAAARALREKTDAQAGQRLTEVTGFGANPGNLKMLTYVPQDLPASAPLVVVLHGCTQTAASYDHGTGWSTLADRFGFALLLPEQKRANNLLQCFNWFKPDDTGRGSGEALSIREMIERMIALHGVDPKRVFITGVSAGGAMSSVMLATYPELFAGGAIIAGVPYRSANGLQEAFDTIFQGRSRSGREWGDLVRAASAHDGPWPKVSVWHGAADSTVKPVNADEIVKQWADVHNLAPVHSHEHVVEGHLRRVWHGPNGEDIIESYTVAGMGHGVPIDPGDADHQCGNAAPFILDVGISSTWHIARSWGLTENRRAEPAVARPAAGAEAIGAEAPQWTPKPDPAMARDDEAAIQPDLTSVIFTRHRKHGEHGKQGEHAGRTGSEGTSSSKRSRPKDDAERQDSAKRQGGDLPGGIDIQAILTKSFELAGLATKLGTSAASARSGGGTPGGVDIQAILAKSFELAGLAKGLGETATGGTEQPPGHDNQKAAGNAETGWAGEGWQLVAESRPSDVSGDDVSGDGRVLFGQVSSGSRGDGGTRVRTVSRRMFLGQRPSLGYRRRLDLGAAVNMYTNATFAVLVDGVVVDEVSSTGMDYAESAWTERTGIDLAEFADRTVTLTFQVTANSNVCAEVTAKAWIAGIAVEDAGTSGAP